jgi:hypothetical protein
MCDSEALSDGRGGTIKHEPKSVSEIRTYRFDVAIATDIRDQTSVDNVPII